MNVQVFLGSARTSTPPRPARLGERVAFYCRDLLAAAGHEVMIIDPLRDMPQPATADFKPHFSYAPGKAPEALNILADKISAADAYVMVSPEYNHSMSPALSNMLNHFGSSLFSWKPSAIVTYSAGQWGGARAAISMRSFISELGCLPVSAMTHIPKAQNVLNEDGSLAEGQDRVSWDHYCNRAFDQMTWWALAAQARRDVSDPETISQSFKTDPSQRDAGKITRVNLE